MSIQSAINQGIAVTSLLASQSPSYKDAVEKRNLNRSLDKINDASAAAVKNLTDEAIADTEKPAKTIDAKIDQLKDLKEANIRNVGGALQGTREITDPINKRLAELGDEKAAEEYIKTVRTSPKEFADSVLEPINKSFDAILDRANKIKEQKQQTDELKKMKEADKRASRKKAAKLQQAAFVKNYIASGGKLDLTTSFEQAKKERK